MIRPAVLVGLAYRQWRLLLASPHNLLSPILEPTIYLVIFAGAMGGVVPAVEFRGAPVSYVTFVTPGILAMAAWQRGVHASGWIWVDRMTGDLENLFGLPLQRWHILSANIASAVVQSLLYMGALVAAATAIGAELVYTLVVVAQMSLTIAGFTWFVGMVFCAIYSMVGSQETFNIIMNVFTLPLVFTSSALYPIESAPLWIRAVAAVNPIHMATEALRAITIGGGSALQDIIPLSILLAVCVTASSVIAGSVFHRSVR